MIINQIVQSGWTGVKIGTIGVGTSGQLLVLTKKNSEGLLMTSPFFFDMSNPRERQWVEKFTARSGFQPTVHPAVAYDCVYLLAAAIKASGVKVTRESIRFNLQNQTGFVGLTGPIKFNPDGDVNRKYVIVAVENGQYVRKTDFDYGDK